MCLLISTSNGLNQSSETYLAEQILTMKASEEKVDKLNELASQMREKNTVLAMEYINESLRISRDIKYIKGEALGYQLLADIDTKRNRDVEALNCYQKALNLFESLQNQEKASYCLNSIAHIHFRQKNYEKALEYMKKVEALVLKQGQKEKIIPCYNNLGSIYQNMKLYDKALEYYSESLKIDNGEDSDRSRAICYNNMGDVWRKKGNLQKGIELYRQSLKLAEKQGNMKEAAYTWGSLADACNSLSTTLSHAEERQESLQNALVYAGKSLELGKELNDFSIQQYALRFLSDTCKHTGQFEKALKYREEYETIHNKLYNQEKAQAIAKLETSFAASSLQKQNDLLRKHQNATHSQLILEIGLRHTLITLVIVICSFFVYILLSLRRLKIRNTQLRDLNQKIKAQTEVITENEARFRKVFNDSNDGFFWTDPKRGIITNCNHGAEILLEAPMSDIVGKSADFFFPEENKLQYVKRVEDALKKTGKVNDRFQLITSSGRIKHVSSTVSESMIEGRIIRQAVVRDITNEVLAEKALKQREQELKELNRALLEQRHIFMVGDVVVFKWENADGWPVTYVSENVPRVLGYTVREFVEEGLLFADLISEESREDVEEELRRILLSGNDVLEYPELRLQRKDGTWMWVYIFSTIERDVDENVSHYFGYLFDITVRKEAQAALALSESKLKASNATKDLFFSIIAHDLKNPFSNILGFCDLLQMNYDRYPDEKRKGFIRNIERSARNTFKLLENLLTWSKSQRGMISIKPEQENLFLLWSEAFEGIREMASKKNIEISEFFDEELLVSADRNMLLTIFRNLLTNAIKFTPKGAWIKVSAGVSPNAPECVQCCVEDSGVGISPENMKKLFGLGGKVSTQGTEHETGTGLGLILCKDFIEKHGGHIWVESEPEKGSRFFFTLHRA
jgi:PAS domain S-box-containing protein